MIVELVELPKAKAAALDLSAKPYPLVPSVEANLSDFTAIAEGVFKRINALKVEELIASAIGVLDSVNVLVASDGVKAVLPEMTATLAEARVILAELREAGAGVRVNATLAAAEGAASAGETAATKLPALAEQLEKLAVRTEAALTSYGEKSRLVSIGLDALRDISEAGEALKSLARTIQRNPNSLLFGR